LLLPRLSAAWGTLMTLSWVGLLVAFNLYAWNSLFWVVPLGYTLALVVALFLFQQTTGFFFETRNRMKLAGTFGQYIPPEIVAELNSEGAHAQLQGESRDMTVFFSDIRGFTGLSETLTPQQLTRMMNIYLTPMTEVIHDNRGTVDKYIGDAVMAFWGAPLEDPQHPRHALDAAMQMQQALTEVNTRFAAEGLPQVAVGMGLHTGEMNVGNMGSSFRMAYTVMGDAVNLGSRLEGLTKFYGVPILVSGELAARVPEYCFLELDLVRVKGRREPVTLLQPLGLKTDLDARLQDQATRFAALLEAYRAQEWERTLMLLTEVEELIAHSGSHAVLHPRLLGLYRDRISAALEDHSGAWDGVYSHISK